MARSQVYPELRAIMTRAPDYRGLFLRGYGSQTHVQNNGSLVGVTTTTHASGALGAVQGDATRRLTGSTNWLFDYRVGTNEFKSGMLYSYENRNTTNRFGVNWNSNNNTDVRFIFDSGQMVPVDGEERPANMAVRYLIRVVK